jgi:xylulokinase
LRTNVTRAQLARAAFEGVVCGLLDGVDALRESGVNVDDGKVVLIGGGARSAAYRQILADVSQREIEIAHGDEHVATGACLQAAAALRGASPPEVGAGWERGPTSLVAPNDAADHKAIRAAYAAARG